MCFDAKNECITKKNFQECHMKDFFLLGAWKESTFWKKNLDVNFWEYFKCELTWCLLQIIDWINLDLVMNFWNQNCEAPKGPLMSRTQMITIFTIIVLMINLDHSLLHVLNK
jgi:hypothetical protein